MKKLVSDGESDSGLQREQIFKGRVVDLGMEEVTLPDGRKFPLEVVRHPGGSAIAAVDKNNRVCLIRQLRHCAGGYIVELPAGKLEPDEPADLTAQRELAEEAGLVAGSWRDLGTLFSTPGFCDEVIYLYLATDLSEVATDHEADEVIEVFWMDLDEACEQALASKITDSKTVIGLLRAQATLRAS